MGHQLVGGIVSKMALLALGGVWEWNHRERERERTRESISEREKERRWDKSNETITKNEKDREREEGRETERVMSYSKGEVKKTEIIFKPIWTKSETKI